MIPTLASIDEELIPLLAIAGGCVIAIVAIVGNVLKSIVRSRAQEASRREIAAYVAEGSIAPEEAERLLNAGDKPRCG